jgi:hypothetical protein
MKCFISSTFFFQCLYFIHIISALLFFIGGYVSYSLIINIDVIRHSCFCVATRLSYAPRSCGNGEEVLNQEGNGTILLYTYMLIRRCFLNCVDHLYNAEQESDCGFRISKDEGLVACFKAISYSFPTYAE